MTLSSLDHMITQRLSVMGRDSIRSRILIFAVFATLLPSLATAWFSYVENKRSLTEKASEELRSVSTQAARELDLWTKERRYDLRVFASSYEVTENLERMPRVSGEAVPSGRAYQHLTDYLKSVHERFADYEELLILDGHGHVVASSVGRPDAITLPADWLAEMRSDNLVLGTPYWDARAGRPAVLIAVPIGGANGRFLGALTAKVDLSAVAQTLKRFSPGQSGRVFALAEDGATIVSSRENSAAGMATRYPVQTVRSHLALNRPAKVTDITVGGEQVVWSAQPVTALNWIVVAEISCAEVFAQLAHLRNVTLLIMAGMLAVAATLGYVLGVVIVRPLNRLTRGAAKVAAGDLAVDLPIASGGEVGYLTEVFNNMVARLRTSREELELLSVTDPMTGLYNRRRMMEVLENEVRRSQHLEHTFAVLMADVDHFKQYNDAHGHPAGDEVLKRVARLLSEATRDVDFVARYGGEEFFVLMPETDVERAAEVADRIRAGLIAEMPEGGVTLSFGIAEFPVHGETGPALIAVADSALYEAKREGRDQVVAAPVAKQARVVGR
jgi:diguanylate cyclase (GGDEF)-like protein